MVHVRLTRSLCLQEILPWLSSASLSTLILLEHTPFLKLLQLPQFLETKWFGLVRLINGKRMQKETRNTPKLHASAWSSPATKAFSWCISWCANLTNSSFGIRKLMHGTTCCTYCTKWVQRKLEQILEFDVHVGAGLIQRRLPVSICILCHAIGNNAGLLLVRPVDSTKIHKSLAVMSGRLPASGSFPQSLTNWETLTVLQTREPS